MEILKSKERPLDIFRDLLKGICTMFAADPEEASSEYVRVSCPWEESGSVFVSPGRGFALLEIAEATMESAEQLLELVVVDYYFPLPLLASRLKRQRDRGLLSKFIIRKRITVMFIRDLSSFSSVVQHCQEADVQCLEVVRDLGQEGWTTLRGALSAPSCALACLDTMSKGIVTFARREDLRAIWECVTLSWRFPAERLGGLGGSLVFEKRRGAEGLAALERFLDMTNGEWVARRGKAQAVRSSHLFVNGQQVLAEDVIVSGHEDSEDSEADVNEEEEATPYDHLGAELVVFEVDKVLVEMQMLEPGWPGLRNAFQQVVLFHPAFDQRKQEGEVDQREMANGYTGTKSREPRTKYLIRCRISRDGGCKGEPRAWRVR